MDTTLAWRIRHYENKIYQLRCKLDTFRKGVTRKLRAFVISLIWEIERLSEKLEDLLAEKDWQDSQPPTEKIMLTVPKGKKAWLARLSPEIDHVYGGFTKKFIDPELVTYHSKTVVFCFEFVLNDGDIFKDSDGNHFEVRDLKYLPITYREVCQRFNKEQTVESTPNVVQLLKQAAHQQGTAKGFTQSQITSAIAQYFNFNSISRLQSTGIDWALIQVLSFAKNY